MLHLGDFHLLPPLEQLLARSASPGFARLQRPPQHLLQALSSQQICMGSRLKVSAMTDWLSSIWVKPHQHRMLVSVDAERCNVKTDIASKRQCFVLYKWKAIWAQPPCNDVMCTAPQGIVHVTNLTDDPVLKDDC